MLEIVEKNEDSFQENDSEKKVNAKKVKRVFNEDGKDSSDNAGGKTVSLSPDFREKKRPSKVKPVRKVASRSNLSPAKMKKRKESEINVG